MAINSMKNCSTCLIISGMQNETIKRYPTEWLEFKRLINKKDVLSEQCKEIEENNRMGKTRNLFKKIGDIKGTFHARMGTREGRNAKDLTETKKIEKRWQEHTELYKGSLNDLDNHDGVVTPLEMDILECEVKRALGSITTIKASGGDGIPAI